MEIPELPRLPEIWQQTLNWQPSEQQQAQFQQLYRLILEGNRQLNLTRITEPAAFWEKHLWDSIRGGVPVWQRCVDSGKANELASYNVIDIGTGAGFPGFPVAIARPDWTVTLLDSTRKKVAFLEELLLSLTLPNVKTLAGRAEQMAKTSAHKGMFDLALVRAVGSAEACAAYALPLLKPGGTAVLYRGQWTDEDTRTLESVVKLMAGRIETVEGLATPLSQSVRHYVYVIRQ